MWTPIGATRVGPKRPGVAPGIAVAAIMLLGAMLHAAQDGGDEAMLQRALDAFNRRASEYQTIRHLRAAALSGKHEAWLDAEVALESGGALTYRVLDEGGSKRTRNQVLLAVLEAERDTNDHWERSALTSDNYTFTPEGRDTRGAAQFRVTPKRIEPCLVDGVLTVAGDGHPVMFEGRLAKAPSFWIRSVTVIRRFATINGISLPIAVESLADVRLVGPAAFSMEYEYTAVDGVPVSYGTNTVANGPSPRLLTLHAAFKGWND